MPQATFVPPGIGKLEVYPTPLVSHEKIVNDPNLFMDCLKNFHSTLGTKYTLATFSFCSLKLLPFFPFGFSKPIPLRFLC